MAKVSFDNAIVMEQNNNNNTDVGFLSLRDDGDEAIVRFLCDSTDDFDIHVVHPVNVDGRTREVNCLRDPHDALDVCPLCKSGANIQQKFFIRMIQYIKNDAGQIIPKPVVWERSLAYAKTLKSYLDNYGPLSDIICKIIRHGKKGDTNTKYEIVPNLSKQIYRDDLYPKVANIFGDYSVIGRIVLNKNAEEINTFLATGKFPMRQQNNNQAAAGSAATPRTYNESVTNVPPMNNQPPYIPAVPTYDQHPVDAGAPQYNAPPAYNPIPSYPMNNQPATPQFDNSGATRQSLPWENPSAGGFDRPRRY